jgi:hypothetical protein
MKKKLLKKVIGGVLISTLLFSTTVFANGTWSQTNGKWTYADSTGALTKGWSSIGGKWHYFDNNGIMTTGWQLINGQYYYLNQDGDMRTGWYQQGSTWYYLKSDGSMAANTWIGSYYLGANGAMLVSTTTPDGYYVGANGAWDGKSRIEKSIFNIGEKAIIQDSFWGTYELTVNSVEITNERNEFYEKNPAEVYKVSYTYKLLAKGTENYMGLFIGDFDSVVDSKGETGDTYPDSIVNYPNELFNVGDYCNAETFVGVNNVTNKLVLTKEYFSGLQSKYVTFVIPTK